MRDKAIHPQKHTLIEHVSDDIRVLHQSSEEQQKVLLTGRALVDINKSDTFESSRVTDQKYFTNSNIDFNKVTDACVRFVKPNTYTNGPIDITAGGFLYTASVLPGGTLTWDSQVSAQRAAIENDILAIRQILYVNDAADVEAYTRIANYNGTSWVWTPWQTLSNRLLRIFVTASTTYLVDTSHIRPNMIYEMHCGGTSIVLPNAENLRTGTTLIFEQYPNCEPTFTKVTTSASTPPSENVRYFNLIGGKYVPAGTNGWISSFVAGTDYYVMGSPSAWMNVVSYSEIVNNEDGVGESRDYETTLTPSLDTLRTSAADGSWYSPHETAVQYKFEVIDRDEHDRSVTIGGVVYQRNHTWMLDVDAESVSRMADFAELLDRHTDRMQEDIVQYARRQFKSSGGISGNVDVSGNQDYANWVTAVNAPLVVSRPASQPGIAKITFNTGNISSLTSGFMFRVFKFNELSVDGHQSTITQWTPVSTSGATPNMYQRYYIESDGVYSLAGDGGYLTEFTAGVTYYTKSLRYTSSDVPVSCHYRGQIKNAVFQVSGAGGAIPFGSNQSHVAYFQVARNDTIMVVIDSGNHVADAAKVTPMVEFYPDPHDSYVMKAYLAKEAIYLESQKNAQSVPSGNPSDLIPNVDSAIKVYDLLARQLQGKGYLFGPIPCSNADSATNTGFYTVTGYANFPGQSAVSLVDASLMVFNSTQTRAQPDGTDVVDNGYNTSNADHLRITQLLICGGQPGVSTTDEANTIPSIWIRFNYGGYWTSWTSFQKSETVVPVSSPLQADTIKHYLRYSNPRFVFTGNAVVNLPDPGPFKGSRMQVEVTNGTVQLNWGSYQYSNSTTKTSPDCMLYPIESNGNMWFVVTAN